MKRAHTLDEKIKKLSKPLQGMISQGERRYVPSVKTPITNDLVNKKRHCNGGTTVNAGLWLRDLCDDGGKIFLAMAGAGSSFQMGITISELIREGKIGAISVTGANLEESLYRYVANSFYAYIRQYQKLTHHQEAELRDAGFRRITDTFLPETESVRVVLKPLMQLWREAEAKRKSYFWHEYFFQLFEHNLIKKDPTANEDDCWLFQAWKYRIPVYVPGAEDSTMGNIFSHATYNGTHPELKRFGLKKPLSPRIMRHGFEYMHHLAEFYMDHARAHRRLGFMEWGGGIAADFPICVVPSILHDFMANSPKSRRLVPPWAGFVSIHSSPMSYGSYSGAGGDEKITWDKLFPDAPIFLIQGDYTAHAPDIANIVLHR